MRRIGACWAVAAGFALASAQLGSGLWPDASVLRDTGTLNLQIVRTWNETVGLQSVRMLEIYYNSWEVRGGAVRAVPVHAYIAIPGSGRRPAVVLAHGLGGFADAGATARFAANQGVVALAYTAPGNGQSGGQRYTPYLLFDTLPDARGSWLWAHSVAGSRAITVLSLLPEADMTRVGMVGYSAGAMATLNVNGFDTRLRMAVAISGTGGQRRSAQEGSWVRHLLTAAALNPDAPQFQRFCDTVDPINQAPSQYAPVLLINGMQDEFFPLTVTMDTFNRFPSGAHRLVLIPNWDHGLFAADLPPPYETFNNSVFANQRIDAGVRFWIGRHLLGSGSFPNVPAIPDVIVQEYLGQTALGGRLSTSYSVVEVHVYYSNDGSWLYGGQRMTDRTGDLWYKLLTGLPWGNFNPSNTVFVSEFRLRQSVGAPEFWVTSRPSLPSGFVPRIRPMPNPPRHPADVNGDGCISDGDLLRVLFAFGQGGGRAEDVNGDGSVDDSDMLLVLFNFGYCP